MTRRIRPVRPGDTEAVYDICLRTADAGTDATHMYGDPHLPGHVWAGAYVAHQPEHGFVVVDDDDAPIGYVLGALDSADFGAQLERTWWPPLRTEFPIDVERTAAADRLAVHLIHHPSAPDTSVEEYPSHLHIDLLPEAQGHGDGRRLMARLLDSLTGAGSPGVHLGVSSRNERAIGFYRTIGFTELIRDDRHLVFGRRLT